MNKEKLLKFLDTTFLVDHQRGLEEVKNYLEDSEKQGDQLVTSTINLKEIAVGKIMVEEPTPTVRDILADFQWLSLEEFTDLAAMEAAKIETDLRKNDRYKPSNAADILIAGVANSLNATIVTRNTSEFKEFHDVSVEEY